jgi:dinuclear metal center YbgI/SA1388 family protein
MSRKSVDRSSLAAYLDRTLDITRFRDHCPNGLQVEGKGEITTVVTGVTASLALLEAALDAGADAVIVHHGYFWRGEDPRVLGPKLKRLRLLLANDINLFAYHLPLDAHPEFGNNAQLARLLGLSADGRFGEEDLGWLGTVRDNTIGTVGALAAKAEACLGRSPLLIGEPTQRLGRVAWCTGAAHAMLGEAIAAGASAYISGEISEPVVHLAREAGVAYLACGHHATERYGVEALGVHLAERFGVTHYFIDIPNPV